MTVSEEDVTVCPECGSKKITQDEDVLDTWFSSALWPMSTLGWPNKTEDLEYFYPTSVLVTGYDIITFWVSKMIFQGLEGMKEKPFSDVLIHGLVRDSQGRKMSKSLGNGIDPLEIIDKYGADALRFTLATGNSPGNDMRFYEERVEASRNFCNKIWNAARFVLMNLDENIDFNDDISSLALEKEDKWILSKYNTLAKEVNENIEKYELGVAVSKLYDFIWDVFCDWYIELVKPRLNAKGTDSYVVACKVLVYVLSNTMKLLHPFTPFITEEIWQKLPHQGDSIMISSFPSFKEELTFADDEENVQYVIEAIKAIRNRRSEMNVPPSKKSALYIRTELKDLFATSNVWFEKLASASAVEIIDNEPADADECVQIITPSATVYIKTKEMVDIEGERKRLTKELDDATKELARANSKLANADFVSKAPAKVIDAEREKVKKYEAVIQSITTALEKLG
jgi:valyl-tRNA synthetase